MFESARVEQITRSDYTRVAEFLENSTEGKVRKDQWLNRFECWWDRNLIQPGKTNGWILIDSLNEIRGFFGYFATPFSLNGRDLKALAATSWFVDHNYRRHSAELLRHFLMNETHCLLYSTTPNEKTVEPILKTLFGFKKIDRSWVNHALVVPYCLSDLGEFLICKFIPSKWQRRLLLLYRPLIVLISPIWKFWVCCNSRAGDIVFKQVYRFESRHQNLWCSVKKHHPLIASRSMQASNWVHFDLEDLRKNRHVVDILEQSGELLGWMVLDRVAVNIHEKKFFCLNMVDLVIDPTKSFDLKSLLTGIVGVARQMDERIMFFKIPELEPKQTKALRKVGILTKKFKSTYLIKAKCVEDKDIDSYWDKGFHPAPVDGDRGFFSFI